VDVDTLYVEDSETIVLAYGSVARSALSAVKMARQKGLKAGFLKLKILWPFPDKTIIEAAKNCKKLIVPEMNIGKIANELERLKKDHQEIISVSKLGGNMHTPEEILNVINMK
jgi:2-oxoglutarate ferredoxin oxidoreductase subunit alpha